MYPISSTALNKFQSGAMQYARITIGTTVITNANIVQGGLSINRYVATGESVTVGSCVAAEMTLSLNNRDGSWNDYAFDGKEAYVEVGVYTSASTITYIPMGYFIIDEVKFDRNTVTLAALDRMTLFDVAIDATQFSFPYTLKTLLASLCTICGVTLGTTGNFTNYSRSVTALPSEAKTYRDLLKWICELSGTNGYIKYDGKLYIEWYSTTSGFTMTTANRKSSEVDENTFMLTGVTILSDEQRYSAGTSTRPVLIQDNPFALSNQQNLANNLNTKLNGFTWTPFSAQICPAPHLYPLDRCTFTKKDNTTVAVSITGVTFTLNRDTSIAGGGDAKHNGRSYGLKDATFYADNIAAGAITADKIAAGSVTADKVATGTLTVGNLNAAAQDAMLNDNIEVGGRNLALRTATMPTSGTPRWNPSADAAVSTVAISNAPISGLTNAIRVTNATSAAARCGCSSSAVSGLSVGEQYTIGCWVRASVAGLGIELRAAWNSNSYTSLSSDYTTTTTWQYVKFEGSAMTGTQTDVYYLGFVYVSNLPADGWFEVCGMKVEAGNKATAWSPAPEDETAYADDTFATKAAASTDTHRIYYRSNSNSAPTAPTTWVTSTTTNNATWSVRRMAADPENVYKYIWVCTQVKAVNGTITNSTVLLDDTTTVIDGGNIITGSVDANQIRAGAITTEKINSSVDMATNAGVANTYATKAAASSSSQRIYYRSNSNTAPTAPTSYVTSTSTANKTWTLKRMPIVSDDSGYKYIWTCTQTKTVSGTVSNSAVLLDDTITVIDGGNIITGSVDANQIHTGAITAEKIDPSVDMATNAGVAATYETISNAQSTYATKATAASTNQRIYYRKSATGAPTAPTTWVTATSTANNTWTTKHMSYDETYKYLYTCIQTKTVSGAVSNSTVLLDDTITVIDGGSITTGKVAANRIDVTDLNAFGATIANWSLSDNMIYKTVTLDGYDYRLGMNAPNNPTASNAAFFVQRRAAGTSDQYVNIFSARYDGTLVATNANITGGSVSGSTVGAGVNAGNITTGTLSADRIGAGTITTTKIDPNDPLADYATNTGVASTYETKTDASNTYETKSNASSTYETKTNASNTYETKTNAQSTYATKAAAASTNQRIYYRKSATGAPTAPATWITSTSTANETWTTKRMPYDATYKYLYTCIQTKTVSGDVSNSTVLLDDTTTVIDGGSITTGKVAANRVDVNDLSAFQATIAGWGLSSTQINKSFTIDGVTYKAYMQAKGSDAIASNGAFVIARTENGTTTYPFVARYNGKVEATNADIQGAITATSGKIGNWEIDDDSLICTVNGDTLAEIIVPTSETSGYISFSDPDMNDSATYSSNGITSYHRFSDPEYYCRLELKNDDDGQFLEFQTVDEDGTRVSTITKNGFELNNGTLNAPTTTLAARGQFFVSENRVYTGDVVTEFYKSTQSAGSFTLHENNVLRARLIATGVTIYDSGGNEKSKLTLTDLKVNGVDLSTFTTTAVTTPTNGTPNSGSGGVYYEYCGHNVHVHVAVTSITADTNVTIFTLPTALRPATFIFSLGVGASFATPQVVQGYISTNGNVIVRSPGTAARIDFSYMI